MKSPYDPVIVGTLVNAIENDIGSVIMIPYFSWRDSKVIISMQRR